MSSDAASRSDRAKGRGRGMKLYTAGHTTSALRVFVRLLTGAGIGLVVDVRSRPRSRLPHFDQIPSRKRWATRVSDTGSSATASAGCHKTHACATAGSRERLDPVVIAHLRGTDEWGEGIGDLARLADLARLVSRGDAAVCVICSEADPRVPSQGRCARRRGGAGGARDRAPDHREDRTNRGWCPRSQLLKRAVVLLDVTEMAGHNVCIAGIDLERRQQIRLSTPQPTRTTVRNLGKLTPGDVLSVGWEPNRVRGADERLRLARKVLALLLPRRQEATRPHVEDGGWDRESAAKSRSISHADVLALLEPLAFDSVEDAFGPPFTRGTSGNRGWKPGQGDRSLATVRAREHRVLRTA